MRDYEVNTTVIFNTGFDDRECNELMFKDMKDKIVNDIRGVLEEDETLAEHITGSLTFSFSGYKVTVKYIFSCNDENEAEAESFSNYCLEGVRDRLLDEGYTMERITCQANEMDMEWLDRLENLWFG